MPSMIGQKYPSSVKYLMGDNKEGHISGERYYWLEHAIDVPQGGHISTWDTLRGQHFHNSKKALCRN